MESFSKIMMFTIIFNVFLYSYWVIDKSFKLHQKWRLKIEAITQSKLINDKGEVQMIIMTLMLIISSFWLLMYLQMKNQDLLIKKRIEITLCTQEQFYITKDLMGKIIKTNWVLENIKRAAFLATFIPGLQASLAYENKVSEVIKKYQQITFLIYLKKFLSLKIKKCPLYQGWLKSPLIHQGGSLKRDIIGKAILRERKSLWNISHYPYFAIVNIQYPLQDQLTVQIRKKIQLFSKVAR